ncbi:uncharacterized protein LOC129228337 [Uloborus diversus]|uniref:uncharacterized protein LOC129228337 n=1 Tax=Uloborus diversus TaxID=327109 RepID=UPI0024093EC0|nr:uncharacterized protein LOC129228337 [Uloborus diversus]
MKLKRNSYLCFFLWVIVPVESKPQARYSKDCDCHCSESSDTSLCDRISKIETVLRTVVKAIADRTYLINEVKHLNIWKDSQVHVTKGLIAEIQQLKDRLDVEVLPSSQPLIGKPDDKMQNDADSGSGGFEEEKREATKEVSELLAKVEEVENRTIQVQETLESERRVRRHLEESLNETRTSVHLLGDKLQNITTPESNKRTQVEEVLLSTLESMNKTLFEDHLQKLYYKVDGVVYQNETKLLSERLNQVEIEVQESNNYTNNNNLTELTALVKNLEEHFRQMNDSLQSEITPRYNITAVEIAQMERIKHLEDRLMSLSNRSEALKSELEEIRNNIESSDDLREKFLNFTDEWKSSLSYVGEQMSEIKRVLAREGKDVPMFDDSTVSMSLENETIAPKTSMCGHPDNNKPNLLITMDTDESGIQHLSFGCFPIGLYILSPVPVPARCENGIWIGPFPTCVRLPDEEEIHTLHSLKNFIPPIHIHPNNLDKPYGFMGTGPLGEMIVYPGTTFTLQCLFPNTVFGQPRWFAYNFLTGLFKELENQKEGNFHYSLKIVAAKQSDSGLYTCKTPYGKESSITVIVKEIECPPISSDEEIEEAVFYRPTPEGQHRIISTTAQFKCEDGRTIRAVCLANGTWSRKAPTAKECHIKNTKVNLFWGCLPLDFTNHPHLTVERDEEESKLSFGCEGRWNLIGPSSIICTDDKEWTRTSLPRCERWGESLIGDQDIINEVLGDY